MYRNSFKTLVAIVMLAGFAARAAAQEGIVTPKAPRAVAISHAHEHLPPPSVLAVSAGIAIGVSLGGR